MTGYNIYDSNGQYLTFSESENLLLVTGHLRMKPGGGDWALGVINECPDGSLTVNAGTSTFILRPRQSDEQ